MIFLRTEVSVLRSLINITRRRNRAGGTYYQARFFDKDGRLLTAKSLPDADFWSEAYGQARDMMLKNPASSVSKEDAYTSKTLTCDEVKAIYKRLTPAGNASDGNPPQLRAFAAVLLGLTGGLGVGEVINARFENLNFETNLLKVTTGDISRQVPITARGVAGHISKLKEVYQASEYIIPNIGDMSMPCNPITIKRSLEYVLQICNIDYKTRKIVYSDLRTAFVSYLLEIKTGGFTNKSLDREAIDYLCGYQRSIKYSKLYDTAINFQINLENLRWHPNDGRWLNYKSEYV
jgi:integrase